VHQGGYVVGDVADVMTEEQLSAMYGIDVEVSSFEGHRIVLATRARTGEHRHGA
jgi:ABC-type cobalamin transport system ATPase subunit